MYKIFILFCLALGPGAVCYANTVPPYVQAQVDNLNQEITQLKGQRDQLTAQMQAIQDNSDNPNASFQKQGLQAQIDRLNSQIDMVQRQVEALQKTAS